MLAGRESLAHGMGGAVFSTPCILGMVLSLAVSNQSCLSSALMGERTGRPCLFYAVRLPAWFDNNPHRCPAVPTKAELRSYTTQQNTKAKEHHCISAKQEPN